MIPQMIDLQKILRTEITSRKNIEVCLNVFIKYVCLQISVDYKILT